MSLKFLTNLFLKQGHFIIDASALTKGLGNIKKWVDEEQYTIQLFIPSYTIHELDYLKKGITMIATNARESIRFIERVVSSEEDSAHYKMVLETPEDVGPNWRKCLTYKVRSPKVHEFPNSKQNNHPLIHQNAIKYENEQIDSQGDILAPNTGKYGRKPRPERAEIPARYKYLIRPCIKKTHIDQEDWKLITEDQTTRTWCESFGIKCINIAEAESLLFHKKNQIDPNETSYTLKSLSLEDEKKGSSAKIGGRRRRSSPKKNQAFKASEKSSDGNARLEDYDSISYAPRGSGELWVP
ncbi:Nonsense-mediated decay protein 4 [Wickerhamomyces ciferrii]|uniref:Nonsense-mediated decay protein 4 n=1 Tax=Wickerhamomyces ciferrii (strain ATCC 14091 / BCRC 22168 / CBS 111 / JCM 3599 / NBRC 0793 / NRRL Y-1031 F-60-10) TaxID=1206466 RepID=K0KJR3_WICCF|nr:Nonsense-mediated decay protein 4 [Wickerhamomyces ciferrii]CCH45505.1 Nonsense-mediated decay protein 4 [Wickerhamomyces ciferrii]